MFHIENRLKRMKKRKETKMNSEKSYYWLKLPKDFFKRHDIKYIMSLPEGEHIVLFYLQLMVESIDHDGELRFSPNIPYTDKMLASVTNTDIEVVKASLEVLKELELVKVSEDGTIVLDKVKTMTGYETKWAEKKRKYREQKGQSEDNVLDMSSTCPQSVPSMSDKSKSKSKSKNTIGTVDDNLVEVSPIIEDVRPDSEVMFEQFWSIYPKKVDKKGSLRAFKNIKNLKAEFPNIISAVEVQKKSLQWQKDNGQYIPNPTTYIHQERWKSVNEADNVQAAQDQMLAESLGDFSFWGEEKKDAK